MVEEGGFLMHPLHGAINYVEKFLKKINSFIELRI